LEEFVKNENDILSLTETSKNIIPFKMRAQKLVYPNNKCISIINYKKGNVMGVFFSLSYLNFHFFSIQVSNSSRRTVSN